MAGDLDLLRAIVAQRMVVIKPYNGRRGIEVRTVRDLAELARIAPPTLPTLVQDYVSGDELKVYVIGEHVFGIRKFYTATGAIRVASPVSDEARAIALRCGRIFGLGLYGLDLIESVEGPVVIDLSYFPSYKGIPGAASALADYIYAYSKRPPLAAADILNNSEDTTPMAS
jgi:ribosomal protein S6--L-glutamate ligase